MIFAIVGTLSMFVVFACIKVFAVAGYISLSNLEIMVLGDLISSTDPVATLNVFGTLHAHPIPYTFVFGESVLNDAVAIVLFQSLLKLYGVPEFTAELILKMVGFLFLNAFGSMLIGVKNALIA